MNWDNLKLFWLIVLGTVGFFAAGCLWAAWLLHEGGHTGRRFVISVVVLLLVASALVGLAP